MIVAITSWISYFFRYARTAFATTIFHNSIKFIGS